MMKQFEQLRDDTRVLDYLEERDTNDETNMAIKELYPDMEFTIDDVIKNDSYTSKNLNSLTYNITKANKPNKLESKSVMDAYGQLNQSQSGLKSSIFTDYRKHSIQNVKKSTSLAQIQGENSEILNLFPKVKSRRQLRSIEGSRAKHRDPLGLRRLGVYKNTRFSVSIKSRATKDTSNFSNVHSKSLASGKTNRFALSIPYE
mmetsp:Transcript_22515/g.19996  ORF Transcript_22515/g.19996 Transcript_22515/m.19996 type:complete len:202 (+) Transcript_22515:327-932(+)